MDVPEVQSRIHPPRPAPQEPRTHMTSDLVEEVTSWLALVGPELELIQRRDPATSIPDLEARVKRLKVTIGWQVTMATPLISSSRAVSGCCTLLNASPTCLVLLRAAVSILSRATDDKSDSMR